MHFVEYYNLMIVLLYVCVCVCVCARLCICLCVCVCCMRVCVCVCVGICVIVSTGVLNCIVLYLHLKIMSYCQYAINYSNHKNIRYKKMQFYFTSF